MRNIINDYFNWMCELAFPVINDRINYDRLLNALNATPFRYKLPLDEDRMIDGIDLRYRYCYEKHLENEVMEGVLSSQGCSMLEMMIALALRCDEHIMYDFKIGGRIDLWFFKMIKNLNLNNYTNDNFNGHDFLLIIERLLRHEYEPNGRGGLFTINNRTEDIRTVEIWYQLNWYLNENYK